jgi:AcrR family transcriptional regulator
LSEPGRPERRADTRTRIVEAALACLAAHGFGGTTARAVAQCGGFAPGVIYYHFEDLDDLIVAALTHSCTGRLARYREALDGVDRARPAVRLLRELYAEDVSSGHVAAVCEIYGGARPGTALADRLAVETARFEALAEELLTVLLRGKPLATLVRIPVAARAAVAFYVGLETLTHLDQDRSRPTDLFAQAERAAAVFDRIPRVRRRL